VDQIGTLRLVEPLDYLTFLGLMARAKVVITVRRHQEETTVLGVRCITVRENTERPDVPWNQLSDCAD
jgi:UDP-N-acetylglucosamine 2-epimerase (non-hydrolysing)